MLRISLIILSILIISCESSQKESSSSIDKVVANYQDLTELFEKWRVFERPPNREGAPDYTATTFEKRWPEFRQLQQQLLSMDTAGWAVEEKVDWMIVWAEMNGYDFNHRILKPWARDPAFYYSVWESRSDVPAHEGPTHHGITEVWLYDFPVSGENRENLINDLKVIPPLNIQAQQNLTGNAKELWLAGIGVIEYQDTALRNLLEKPGVKDDQEIVDYIEKARNSTNELVNWLKQQAKSKTGSSGIGKENYTWYLQNVHLVPLTWEDEVMLLKRELARAWSSLKMEEHRNRDLPELVDANSAESYDVMADAAAKSLIGFLDEQEIVTVSDYFDPALREHLGEFVPKEKRNFFVIGEHYDPRPLYSHFYHWFELARMDLEPHASPIRKGPLLYNIFDSRNEGTATAVEELFMQAGLYDDAPRVKEIVYIMIAQRAARGLGSLYAHANEMTMEEAGGIHSEYTPRGWMKTEKELLLFEQHLYMRQPGYGTSYITGKYLLENTIAEVARIKELNGESFVVKEFFDHLNSMGNIPISLGHWQMTNQNMFQK